MLKKSIWLCLALTLFLISGCLTAKAEPAFSVQARSAILVDFDSGTILYEKNIDDKLPIASMTKIMSLCIIFDEVEAGNLSFTDKVTVSEKAAKIGGSHVFTDANWAYPAGELIKSIIIASANDATMAMAEHISGNEETFVARMNKKAQELGMTNTVFVNCTGLPAPGQYSTARDVATMSRELLKHKDFFKWSNIWMDEIKHKDGRKTELVNTNRLVRFFEGCDGVKTGYTSEAKHCVAATVKRGDTRMISVIIGADTSQQRFDDARTLINYGFANFTTAKVVTEDELKDYILPIKGAAEKTVIISPEKTLTLVLPKGEDKGITKEIKLPPELTAPIAKGQPVGEIIISKEGHEIMRIKIVAAKEYNELRIGDIFKKLIRLW